MSCGLLRRAFCKIAQVLRFVSVVRSPFKAVVVDVVVALQWHFVAQLFLFALETLKGIVLVES